jgi:glycosyltransferase involved in cell wall biosynthesis
LDLTRLEAGSSVLTVGGWALLPGAGVARVGIRLNGSDAGYARLGIPRPDLADAYSAPEAPSCGFLHLLDLTCFGEPEEVTLEALIHGTDGSTLELRPRTLHVGATGAPFEDLGGRAAVLRERASRVAGARDHASGDGRRVLGFVHDLELGGAQLFLYEALRRLITAAGWSCTLVSPGDGPLRERFEDIGVPVHITSGYGLEGLESYEGKMAELAGWVAAQDFDLVLANTVMGTPGVDLAERLGIPSVIAVHESVEFPRWSAANHRWHEPDRYVRERMEQAFGKAGAVVFEAGATCRQYRHLGDPACFLGWPYAVELDDIARHREGVDRAGARRRLGIPPEATALLCLGTFEPRKAQSTVVQAFRSVAERHPEAWLCLVGDRGNDYSAAVREQLDRAGLWDRVLVRPMVQDPYEWLEAADALVLGSDIESLPRVVLEAMAFETPIVATRIFGLAELLEDGRTAHLCEPRDADALAAALDRALSAPEEEREAMTEAASSVVWERHHPDDYARAFEALLESVLRGESVEALAAAPASAGWTTDDAVSKGATGGTQGR